MDIRAEYLFDDEIRSRCGVKYVGRDDLSGYSPGMRAQLQKFKDSINAGLANEDTTVPGYLPYPPFHFD